VNPKKKSNDQHMISYNKTFNIVSQFMTVSEQLNSLSTSLAVAVYGDTCNNRRYTKLTYSFVSTSNYVSFHNIRSPVVLTPFHLLQMVKLDTVIQPIIVSLRLSETRVYDVGNKATSFMCHL
jgi:hypothetical protein